MDRFLSIFSLYIFLQVAESEVKHVGEVNTIVNLDKKVLE